MRRLPLFVTLVAGLWLLTMVEVLWLTCIGSDRKGAVYTTDTALSTEAAFIRHRSLADLADVFGQGPGLLPYFPSDYVYAPPPYLRALEELR